MDFLNRIRGFLGNIGQQAGRAISQVPRFANRGVQEALRAQQQAVQEVQRNLPRFQPPPIPRIVLPQIPKVQIPRFQAPQIPRFQAPPVPRVDLNAVNRALGNYYNKTALSKTPENLQNIGKVVSPVVRQFSGATGEGLNTLRSAPAVANVLTAAQIQILGKAIGNKSIENKANLARQKAFAEYARQSQTGINPVGSAQQIAIDKGGLSGLGAFTKAFGTKGLKAGLEIAPAVTGLPAGASVLSTLGKGGTLGAGGNVLYSGLSGSYKNKSAKDLALQAAADVAMGYGGELGGIGLNKVIGKAGSALLGQKGLTPQLPSMYGKAAIGQDVPASFLQPKANIKAKPTELNAEIISRNTTNSFLNNPEAKFDKPDRFTGQQFSYNEAKTGLTAGGKDLPDRIKIGKDDAGNIIIKDGRHLLEAHTELNIPIPARKIKYEDGLKSSDVFGQQLPVSSLSKGNRPFNKLQTRYEELRNAGQINTKEYKAIEAKLKQGGIGLPAPQVGKTDLPSMYGKGSIGQDVPESFFQPKSPTAQQVPLKASGIAKSLEKSGSKIYADIPGYVPVKNKALLNISENRVALDERAVINSIVNRQPNQPVTPQMNADSVYLLNKLLKEGRDDEALAIAKATAKNATSAGRAVQILSRLQQTTPEGALVKAQKIVNEVNDKAKKQIVTLDAKNQEDIIALANQVQKYKPGTRDYQKAAGELMKYMENLKPVSRGAKVSMIQTMAQLLNPKTAIRNVVGNLGMSGGEDIASIPAALLDKIVSVKTGIRTTSISNPIVGVKGAIKGFKYGVEDTKLGIKTLGSQTKFDIRPDVFKKGIMKKLQNALGYELGVPDKAFYQSAFDKTLDSVMRANKTKTPTAEMLDIANAEALYATFQNNSAIGNALQKTKEVLNLGKDFGAGDFIIKYPKTPGNIVSVGLDYSPIGIGKGIISLARNLDSMTPSVQREAVRNIGRGITGTGAIAMGAILAQNGIITGRKDNDKDIATLDREQGMGPFTFNATALIRLVRGEDTKIKPGDVVANYDWLQPAAIQLAMGANAVLNLGKGTDNLIGDALESIGDSANTIIEQPVLQGVSRFVNNLNPQYGGGIGKALTDVVSGIPSSFVPGTLNQIGQLTDNTARSTYDPNLLNEALNKIGGRIPGVRTTLQPSVTTLGQPRELYQNNSNNIFNVFFNPAFVKTIKDNEVYNLVKDIQDRSGETQQAPRVADKKIKINGQDKKLSAEEYNRYQTYIGQKTNETFTNLANDTTFSALSDVDKAKYMSGKLTDINAAAKDELFGNKSTSGGDKIKSGELGYEPKQPKIKVSKARRGRRTSGGTGRKGTGRKGTTGKIARIKLPKTPRVSSKGLKAPKAKRVSFKAPKALKPSRRKSIKIKTG